MSSLIIFPSLRSDVPHLVCGNHTWGQVPFLLKGVVWEHAQTHQEAVDNRLEHFRSALRREGVPTPSLLRAWEDTNSADYCAFKEKGGAPWDVPAKETLSWWTLLWGCRLQWVTLGKTGSAHTSELSLEIQVTSQDSAGRKLNRKTSLVPENEKCSSSSPPKVWDI